MTDLFKKLSVIKLEKFTEYDFDNLLAWINSEEELIQFAGTIFSFPLTKEQLYKYVEIPGVNAFKVLYEEENITIGHAEIFNSSKNSYKLCRIIIGDKNYRGKGIGKQIVKELLNICFNKFDSDKVELNVFDWNINAIKCYRGAGFEINKNIYKEIFVKGKKWTSINMFIDKKTFFENN